MEEIVKIQNRQFFPPKGKREGREGEKFQRILKKAFRMTLRLLFLFFLLFVGHRIYIHLLEEPFFRVREVEVVGCRKIAQETLLSLLQMERMPNLFTVSLKEMSKRLEPHPWIDHIVVRKVFPNKIVIQVEERKPIAILQLEDLYYIDARGTIFSSVGDGDEYNYPFLTGLTRQALEREPEEAKGLVMKALELLKTVEKEKASPLEQLSEIHMEKTFGIHCFTQTEGVEVRMGWDHFGEKLRRLSILWSDLQKRGFSAASIDCSDLKRMVVKKISQRQEMRRR